MSARGIHENGGGNRVKFAFTTGPLIPLTRDEKQTARYPPDGIPTGTYVISFTVDGKRYTEKVIVLK